MSHNTSVSYARWEAAHEYLTVKRVRERQDLERVNPVGEVDLCTAPLLRDALAATRDARRVLVDLSGVSFLALIGVRVLQAEGERRTAADQRFVVVASTQNVQRVLSLTEAAGELEIYLSVASARSALAV